MATSTGKTSHVKFADETDHTNSSRSVPKQDKNVRSMDLSDSDSDSDSDDEAPEEEGLGLARDEIESERKKQEAAAELEKQKLKEKRRKENERFKDQQLQKKLKDEEMKKKIAELEKLQQQAAENDNESDDLEEMPEDLLEKFNNVEDESIKTMPQHINFNEIDAQDYVPEIRQEIRKKKKNMLKKLRQTTMNKGVVKVSVISSDPNSSKLAPKKEANILRTKDKWLKRKTLKKK
ncbi:Bud site selection protein 21 [Nakaseomyces bracarensis]|uniref:Bud site selection protein 21 n=1 Tax=Nakaseomyces bracarensis TaxID=273131 RepID=A0ABR4P0A9_9SACH